MKRPVAREDQRTSLVTRPVPKRTKSRKVRSRQVSPRKTFSRLVWTTLRCQRLTTQPWSCDVYWTTHLFPSRNGIPWNVANGWFVTWVVCFVHSIHVPSTQTVMTRDGGLSVGGWVVLNSIHSP